MANENDLPVGGLEETRPDPLAEPAPPPAVIHAAQYDYDGSTVLLMITETGETGQYPYALNATDQNGLSPFLRGELERMVAAGEITIEPAPPAPLDE